MKIGGEAVRHQMERDGIGCYFQYDDEEKPCMVFFQIAAARARVPSPPVCVALLSDLWKYNDDYYLWSVTGEWTKILRGSYSRMEHRNLCFFVNDCLQALFEMKPFPEALREAPPIEIVRTGDSSFRLDVH